MFLAKSTSATQLPGITKIPFLGSLKVASADSVKSFCIEILKPSAVVFLAHPMVHRIDWSFATFTYHLTWTDRQLH